MYKVFEKLVFKELVLLCSVRSNFKFVVESVVSIVYSCLEFVVFWV